MRRTSLILAIFAIGLAGEGSWLSAQQNGDGASTPSAPQASTVKNTADVSPHATRSTAEDRLEGEKRFRANCSRCHQSPHKFAPRAMATIIRHMRVRATLTDEDAHLILKYMSQ